MAFSAIAAVAAVASVAVQVRSANQQKRAAKRAAAERKNQNDISQAAAENQAAAARRRAIREERVRRARILQSAETGGATGSSGAIGATGILSTNLGSTISQANSQTAANRGISASNNRLTDIQAQSIRNSAQNQIFSSVASGVGQIAGGFKGLSFGNKTSLPDLSLVNQQSGLIGGGV